MAVWPKPKFRPVDDRRARRLPPSGDTGFSFVQAVPRLCPWSPDGDHLYQLDEIVVSRQTRPRVVDKCRYCGALAFEGS